jgi:hypothetical protein
MPPTVYPVDPPPALRAGSNGPMTGGGTGAVGGTCVVSREGSLVAAPSSEIAYGRSSMLQSCGRSIVRQVLSSSSGVSAPSTSPLKNRQSSSNDRSRVGQAGVPAAAGAPSVP